MNGDRKSQQRAEVRPGLTVEIIQKADQRSGNRTRGIVREILTGSAFHPHGIKVRLTDGRVGRVAEIIDTEEGSKDASGN
ncbi:MAG: YwbE family protein [Methanoregula sp.]|jgi:uncharacterized repeat protein (TIGR03833 family)|uniref:YwbE family protein n=1 Tax=Methanoregula sp. TaxID=2052170 RepID=UPI003D0AAFEF